MRRAKCGGKCEVCGKESTDGLYWESIYQMLDFGDDLLLEPSFYPEMCDTCELKRRREETIIRGNSR